MIAVCLTLTFVNIPPPVPPTIVDEESSDSEIQVREKKNVTLRCSGRGRPAPRLMWRREDGGMIVPDDKTPGEGEGTHRRVTFDQHAADRMHACVTNRFYSERSNRSRSLLHTHRYHDHEEFA